MKRKLWIILTLTVLVMVLACNKAAMADQPVLTGLTVTSEGINYHFNSSYNTSEEEYFCLTGIDYSLYYNGGNKIGPDLYTMRMSELYSDADCTTLLTVEPKMGDVFYVYYIGGTNRGTFPYDLTQLQTYFCHLAIPGYAVEAVSVSYEADSSSNDWRQSVKVVFKATKSSIDDESIRILNGVTLSASGLKMRETIIVSYYELNKVVCNFIWAGDNEPNWDWCCKTGYIYEGDQKLETLPAYGQTYKVKCYIENTPGNQRISFEKLTVANCSLIVEDYTCECTHVSIKQHSNGTRYAEIDFNLTKNNEVLPVNVYVPTKFVGASAGIIFDNNYILAEQTYDISWQEDKQAPADKYKIEYSSIRDENDNTITSAPSKTGSYYVHAYFLNENSNTKTIQFFGLATSNCQLQLRGYTAECISVTESYYDSGIVRYYQADILFRLKMNNDSSVLCGDNLIWTYSDRVLTISGTGSMWNYNPGKAPWYPWRSKITSIIIGNTVTTIGSNAFIDCSGLREIIIPELVNSLGVSCFKNCKNLKKLTFQGLAPNIGSDTFADVTATAYYYYDHNSWKASMMQNYGGMIDWKALQSFHFLTQPTGGQVFYEHALKLQWETDFIPEFIEIGYMNNGTWISVDTLTSGFGQSGSYDLDYNHASNRNTWVIHACYGLEYISSVQFRVERIDPTVTFDMQNHGKGIGSLSVEGGTTVPKPPNPTASGWVFGGWYTDLDFAYAHKYDFTQPVTRDLMLYAWWGHTVDFDLNGNGPYYYSISQKKVHEGDCVTMPTKYILADESDTYNGWYIDDWYLESGCVDRFDFTQPVTANMTLYAHWVYDGYTVTYNWNGIHNVTRWRPTGGTYSDIEPDTPVELKTRTGQPFRQIVPLRYTGSGNPGSVDFTGWYTEPECVNPYDFTAAAAGDTTLYAGWANNYTVTRNYTNPYGGMAATFSYTIPYNAVPSDDHSLMYALNDPPHYDGWVVAGYCTDEALTVPFDPDAPLTTNVDIYYKWEQAEYTLTFDANGGTYADGTAVQTSTMHLHDAVTLPAAPTREGYTFLGWNHFSDVTWVRNVTLDTCEGEDLTYYAIWALDGGIAINVRTFPDAVFRSYIQDNIDQDHDQYLSQAEIETETYLDVSSKGISSMTGILYFSHLQTLICSGNSFSSLNLENLTFLKNLTCSSSQLTSLRLVNLPALTSIRSTGGGLTSLNLTGLPSLEAVIIQGNANLSSLTIGGDHVRVLQMNGTQLNEVDISGCPLLVTTVDEGTKVENASYDQYTHTSDTVILTNKGAVLHTAGLPIDEAHFPDAGFRRFLRLSYYDKDQNGALSDSEIEQITSFSGGVSGMYSLEGIGYFPNLNYIVLNNVGLEQIDLSDNPLVETLVVKGNALTTVDVSTLEHLSHLDVANNDGLDTLILGDTPLETLNCYGCPLIRSLDLSNHPHLLKAYMEGDSEVDEDEGFVRYAWQNEGETLLGFLRVDADIDIALPEWQWEGTESAAFILPNGAAHNAEIEREISADGRTVTYIATAEISGVPFTDSQTRCRVSFQGANVPDQELEIGETVAWSGDPFLAGSIFEGWYTDPGFETPCIFGQPITEGFTIYARWTTPEVSRFIKLPAAIRTIESEAFTGIPAQAVIVPRNVSSIAYDAFYGSSIQYIYGFPGSQAESFAEGYDFTFVPIDDAWLASH